MTSQSLTSTLPSNTRAKHNPLSAGLGARVLRRILAALDVGSLTVELPSGKRVRHVGAISEPDALLVLHRWRTLRRVAAQGAIGFAESYLDGDWSTPDLTALFTLASRNAGAIRRIADGSLPMRAAYRALHRLRANTRQGSRRNIAAHYDLGNAFYAAWLDRSMTYSSAIYDRPGLSLEEAQEVKLDRIMHLLAPRANDAVLEIGCGWGALAAKLAGEAKAAVTALTLSREQHDFARGLASERGLADRIDVRLQDYRDVDGVFDRVVSIEMFEAVGEAYWPTYCETLRKRLKPGGRAVLQVITIAEERFERYRSGADFIQHYVFPGGMLPSKTALRGQLRQAGLTLSHEETFGESYAETLAQWRVRFHAAWTRIEPLGFDDRFRRLWDYYLCYCEAGFRTGAIDVGLYVVENTSAD